MKLTMKVLDFIPSDVIHYRHHRFLTYSRGANLLWYTFYYLNDGVENQSLPRNWQAFHP